jgi:O-acetyl-ADP-ribose deacetylase (regulator of RNase III)
MQKQGRRSHQLPAKYIGHTVGPIYDEDEADKCERLLKSCYQSSLELLADNGGGSIGFPAVSTGICE